MDISHDFQFKIQNKIMATLFELNNHVTISKLKFKLGDNLILILIPQNRNSQGELSPKSEISIWDNWIRFFNSNSNRSI